MRKIKRRDFLKKSAQLAALMGLGASAVPQLTSALETIHSGNAPFLWLQGQSCSGCSVSLLNSEEPSIAQVLTEYISLQFHPTLSTATGEMGMNIIHRTIEQGNYYLIIEGSIPEGMPEACLIGGERFTDLVVRSVRSAKAVIALGTCASFGGIPAAENNLTGAVSVPTFQKHRELNKPTILLPGCPTHPDWVIGTLAHVLKFGIPALDSLGRPKMLFSKLVHDQCPRFSYYEREEFAKTFSDEGVSSDLDAWVP